MIPSIKKCKNMNIFNSDFCCTEYNSGVINNDNYLLDDSKEKKEIIDNSIFVSDKINQSNDIKVLDKFDIMDNKKYGNNDILIPKKNENQYSSYIMDKYEEKDKDNFCDKFISSGEFDKNDILLSDKSEYYNKCCILKLYLEENKQLIIWQKIKYIIEEEKNDYKYLQSLFPKINKPTIAKIKCKNFDYIKHFEAVDEDICNKAKNISSKNQCNEVLLLDYQCCFVETIFDSKVNKECYEYDEESLEIEQDMKNYIKFNLILPKLITVDKIILL